MKPSACRPTWTDGSVGWYRASVALPEKAAQIPYFLINAEIQRQSVFSCLSSAGTPRLHFSCDCSPTESDPGGGLLTRSAPFRQPGER